MLVLPMDDYGERIQALRPGRAQVLAVSAASVPAQPLAADTRVIRLVSTAPCFLAFGPAPVATTDSHYLPAGAPEYFRVIPGESLATLRVSLDGALHLSEMS